MQSLNKLIERQTPRPMSLNSTCIQLHLEIMQNRTEQNFYFKIALGPLAGGIICEKSRNIRILAWQHSKKNIFAVDVHVLGQNATAGMQQPITETSPYKNYPRFAPTRSKNGRNLGLVLKR